MKLNKAFALRVREFIKREEDDTIQVGTGNRALP